MFDARVVEAHSVDESLVLGKAEEAGRRVSVLGYRGKSPNFDMAKSKGSQGVDGVAFLVETGGETDGVWEGESADRDWLLLGSSSEFLQKAYLLHRPQSGHGEMVGFLGIDFEEKGAGGRVEGVEHVLVWL